MVGRLRLPFPPNESRRVQDQQPREQEPKKLQQGGNEKWRAWDGLVVVVRARQREGGMEFTPRDPFGRRAQKGSPFASPDGKRE